MPGSFFYLVRRRPSAVPGASWVLLDPPAGNSGATDGHTIGILMPSDRVTDGVEEEPIAGRSTHRMPFSPGRATGKRPPPRH